jgi:FtsH-binding integral membrane protein
MSSGCPYYFLKTFAHLAAGLGIAGVSASNPIMYKAISDNLQGQYAIVSLFIWLGLSLLSLYFLTSSPPNTPIKYVAALTFTIILGQSSGYLIKNLEEENLLARVFFLTTGIFLGMVVVGWYDRQNLMKFGPYLVGALVGLIFAEIILMILRSTNIFSKKTGTQTQTALSFIGVGIFGLMAAQNIQVLKASAASCRGNPDYVTESLNFLLTYVNMFNNIASIMQQTQ